MFLLAGQKAISAFCWRPEFPRIWKEPTLIEELSPWSSALPMLSREAPSLLDFCHFCHTYQ
jgi:hypothetical protein